MPYEPVLTRLHANALIGFMIRCSRLAAYALSWLALSALTPASNQVNYGVRSWSTRDGLPQNSVLDIAQTLDGVLWFATHAGLVQFDGETFAIDDVSRSPALGTSRISQVVVDSAGVLYVGTALGKVLRKRSKGWESIKLPCTGSGRIQTLVCESDGVLWVGSACGAYRVQPGKLEAERLSSKRVVSIAFGLDDEVYLGTINGIFQLLPQQRDLENALGRRVAVNRSGQLFAAGVEKVFRRDGEAWTELPIDAGRIQKIGIYPDDSLWIAGVGVLGCWNDGTRVWWSAPKLSELARDEVFHDILFDREGNLWFGTDSRGLFSFYRTALRAIAASPPEITEVFSVAVTTSGRLFTKGPQLNEVVDGRFVPIDLPVSVAMAPAVEDGLWLDTEKGIELQRDGARELVIPAADLLPGSGALLEARDGSLWFGRGRTLCRWDGRQVQENLLSGLPDDFFGGALFEDRTGRIWIAGMTGLAIWDGVEAQVLLSGYELPLGEIRSFFETESGVIWFGTYGSGLCRFEDGRLDLVDVSRGLFENIASALIPDGQGNLLVMGNRAITRYPIEGLEAVALNESERVRGRVFNSGANIGIFEGNGVVQPRVAVASGGGFWFPSLHGLIHYDETQVPDLGSPPVVRVHCGFHLKSDPNSCAKENGLHSLSPKDRDLSVQFSAASFVQPRQVTYRYRLLGRDVDWTVSRDEKNVRYNNLVPGEYEFQIQAAVADGPFGPLDTSLMVDVLPTWFELQWVKRLAALSLIAGVCAIVFFVIRAARRRSTDLEKVVRLRTCELRSEISERQRVEEDLRVAGDNLELQVEERTKQLERALDNLERDLQEREQLEGRLRESEKLEVVGRLAGGLAHDFNNILTAVLGETDLALFSIEGSKDREDLKPVLVEHLEHVRDSGLRASQLTRQLLAYSRQQVMKPEVIDPLETVKSLRAMLTRLVPDNVEICFSKELESRAVLIDPGQLEQVIVNLVVNAAEAMPEGGLVEVGCRINVGEDGAISTILTVRDSGIGLLPEVRDQIFEPFFSTKGKARGLGLASVQGIVLQSGGSLYVEEIDGGGLAFHVGFPVTDGTPQKVHSKAKFRQVDGVVALLIDDEVEVRRISRLMLEGRGVHVLEARTHDEALKLASKYGSEIDILVTDVVMPGMNGKQLSVEVRKHCPEIKVLFISGHFREELSERDLLEAGANFLSKPFDARQLIERVADLVQAPAVV